MTYTDTRETGTEPVTASSRTARRPVWRRGLVVSVAAAGAVFAGAAAAEALGVSFVDRTDAAIPLAAFPQIALILALAGVGLAAVLARRARRPRSTFVGTTVALLALSLVPVWVSGFDLASALTLVGLHLVAGAIVIPALAARLAPARS